MVCGKMISVAPMMDWTDRHFRYMARCLSQHVTLYTEMLTSHALLHGERERLLAFHPTEHPLVIQLGGSHPDALARCAAICEEHGFDGINLNVGCPSDRVQAGKIGACLMLEPELVARCCVAMQNACSLPVTIKTRIGVDAADSYEAFLRFVQINQEAGVKHFIVHARKAWLKGLSPKENRTKPPLCYDYVYRLKQDSPDLVVELNGGVGSIEEIRTHLEHVDGVMLGRSAYETPYLLAELDRTFFGGEKAPTRADVVAQMRVYIEQHLESGGSMHHVTRHMLNLFHGEPGARKWRSHLSMQAPKRPQNIQLLDEALAYVL